MTYEDRLMHMTPHEAPWLSGQNQRAQEVREYGFPLISDDWLEFAE